MNTYLPTVFPFYCRNPVWAGPAGHQYYQDPPQPGAETFEQSRGWPEMETPNNFCPSRLSQVCPDFLFLQNAESVSIIFLSATQICTMTRKSRHTFRTDLRYGENENLDKLEKIWTDINCRGFLSQKEIVQVYINISFDMFISPGVVHEKFWRGVRLSFFFSYILKT